MSDQQSSIGSGAKFKGKISGAKALEINGEVEADIDIGKITIGQDAHFKGGIKADLAVISGIYEGTIEQIHGLFNENLYGATPRFDDGGHLFQNYKELEEDVQARIQHIWDTVDTDTIDELTDYVGYHNEFLKLFGFGVDGVNYEQDVDTVVEINNLVF